MNKLKLALGQSVTMFVASVTDVPSKYGAEIRFSGRTDADADTSIFLKVATAERQLARLNLTRESAANRSLVFTKTPDNFIDIDFPGTTQGSPPAVAAPPSAAPVMSAPAAPAPTTVDPATAKAEKRAEWEKLVKCYERCVDEALRISVDKFDAGDPRTDDSHITHEGVATMAGSLFDAVLSRGLCA